VMTSGDMNAMLPFILERVICSHHHGVQGCESERKTPGTAVHQSNSSDLCSLLWALTDLFRTIWMSSPMDREVVVAHILFLRFNALLDCILGQRSPINLPTTDFDSLDSKGDLRCRASSLLEGTNNVGFGIKCLPAFEDYASCLVSFTSRVLLRQKSREYNTNQTKLVWTSDQIESWCRHIAHTVMGEYAMHRFHSSEEELMITWIKVLYDRFNTSNETENAYPWNPLLNCLHRHIASRIGQHSGSRMYSFAIMVENFLNTTEPDCARQQRDAFFWIDVLTFTPPCLYFKASSLPCQVTLAQIEQLAVRLLKNERVGQCATAFTKLAVGLGLYWNEYVGSRAAYNADFGSTLRNLLEQTNNPLCERVIRGVHEELCGYDATFGVQWWDELVKSVSTWRSQQDSKRWELNQKNILYKFTDMPRENEGGQDRSARKGGKIAEQLCGEQGDIGADVSDRNHKIWKRPVTDSTLCKTIETLWKTATKEEVHACATKYDSTNDENRERKRMKCGSNGIFTAPGSANQEHVHQQVRSIHQVTPTKHQQTVADCEHTDESSNDEDSEDGDDDVLLLSIA